MINFSTGIFLKTTDNLSEALEVLKKAGFDVKSENIYAAVLKQEVECQLENAMENNDYPMEPGTSEYNSKLVELQASILDENDVFEEFEGNVNSYVESNI